MAAEWTEEQLRDYIDYQYIDSGRHAEALLLVNRWPRPGRGACEPGDGSVEGDRIAGNGMDRG